MLASFGAALIIPENLPDGLYTASLDPRSGDLKLGSTFQLIKSHDKLLAESRTSTLPKEESTDAAPLASLPRRSILHRRDILACNPEGRTIDEGELRAAVWTMENFGWNNGRPVNYWDAIFYRYKDTVVYMCCYKVEGCSARGWELARENKKMTDSCGVTRVAHSHLSGDMKAYGRDSTGYKVCGAQLTLP